MQNKKRPEAEELHEARRALVNIKNMLCNRKWNRKKKLQEGSQQEDQQNLAPNDNDNDSSSSHAEDSRGRKRKYSSISPTRNAYKCPYKEPHKRQRISELMDRYKSKNNEKKEVKVAAQTPRQENARQTVLKMLKKSKTPTQDDPKPKSTSPRQDRTKKKSENTHRQPKSNSEDSETDVNEEDIKAEVVDEEYLDYANDSPPDIGNDDLNNFDSLPSDDDSDYG